MKLKPLFLKHQPDTDKLVEITEMLARIRPDEIIRVDSSDCTDNREFLEILNKAVRLSHDTLSVQVPGNIKSERMIREWISCHPEYLDRIIANPDSETRTTVEEIREMPFINGPFRNPAHMGYVPRGHVIIGMTDNCEEVVRGEVGQNMAVGWFWKIEEQRLVVASQLFESVNSDINNILAQKGYRISIKENWNGQHGSNIFLRRIELENEETGFPRYNMNVSVGFEPGSDRVFMVKLDCPGLGIVGHDVMQCEDDRPEP